MSVLSSLKSHRLIVFLFDDVIHNLNSHNVRQTSEYLKRKWAPEPVWAQLRKEKSLAPVGNRNLVVQPVA
jgi:hypothetical protein